MVVAALTAALAIALGAAPASAGSFQDADARVFTLQGPDGPHGAGGWREIGRLRPLSDGGVLFTAGRTRPNRLWRLHLDGRAERISWAGRVMALAAEQAGTALVIREGRTAIERVRLDSRRRTTVADLAQAPGFAARRIREGAYLAALDDGSIAVADTEQIWRLAPGGRFRRLASEGFVGGLAPVPGGGLLAMSGAQATIRFGPRWDEIARPWQVTSGGVAVTPDGVVVATTDSAVSDPESALLPGAPGAALTELHPSGAVKRHEWSHAKTLGDGDGVGLTGLRWPTPVSMAVAADGSLLFATPRRIRAVVPPDSPRLRLAVTQGSYESLREGRIGYHSAGNGELTLVLRRHGEIVATVRGQDASTDGTIALPGPVTPGIYDLRLRLTSGRGVAEARAHVDLRERLPEQEAAAAIAAAETSSAGDEGGGAGTRVGSCAREAPLVVRCVLMYYESGNNIHEGGDSSSDIEVPGATAWAELERDGGIQTWQAPLPELREQPELRLDVPRRQRFARDTIRAAITVSASARVTVGALIRIPVPGRPGDVASLLVSRRLTRQVGAGERWEAVLPVPTRQARKVRRWLTRGHRVIARLLVDAETDAGIAATRLEKTIGTRLLP